MLWRLFVNALTFGLLARVIGGGLWGGAHGGGWPFFAAGALFGLLFCLAWRDTRIPHDLADKLAMACLFAMVVALLGGVIGMILTPQPPARQPGGDAAVAVPWLAVLLSLLLLSAGLLVQTMRERRAPGSDPDGAPD